MTIYILSYIFLYLFSNIQKHFSNNLFNYFLYIFAFFLVVLSGLRFEVGGDFNAYFKLFYTLKTRDSFEQAITTSGADILYNIINLVVAKIGFNYASVNFVCASIFVICLINYIKIQKDPILALMIAFPYLIIVVSMGYVRQACAIGLFFYALTFLFEKKIYKTFIILIIASFFHKTALILMPLVYVSINIRNIKILFGTFFLSIILFFLLFYENFFGLSSTYVTNPVMESPGVFYRSGLNLFSALVFLIFYKKIVQIDKTIFILYLNLSLGSILVFILQFYSSTFADRIGLYLFPLQLYIFVQISYFFTNHKTRYLINNAIKIFYLILLIGWLNFANHAYLWTPYKNLISIQNYTDYSFIKVRRENIKNEYYF